MDRILALQGLTGSPFGPAALGDSNQSNHCSSSTSECSTQSIGCQAKLMEAIAW